MVGRGLLSNELCRQSPNMAFEAVLWDATHMTQPAETPFQRFLSRTIEMLPKTRNHYDRQIQARLGTSGKPIYDAQRKPHEPKRETLVAMAEVLGQPIDLLFRALQGEDVDPVRHRRPADTIDKAPDRAPTRSISEGDDAADVIVLDLSLPMGPGAEIEDYIEETTMKLDFGLLRSLTKSPAARLRVVKGVGDSMEPTITHDSLVIIDTSYNTVDFEDKIWAVRIRGFGAIKRLRSAPQGQVRIISDNPGIENDIADMSEIAVLGRVVGSIKVH